uniref:Uncharacterized protein n=1 Tax=Cacopsylla melanoneura TaxID=428564 RepID=A0A8D8STB1_9HEMI
MDLKYTSESTGCKRIPAQKSSNKAQITQSTINTESNHKFKFEYLSPITAKSKSRMLQVAVTGTRYKLRLLVNRKSKIKNKRSADKMITIIPSVVISCDPVTLDFLKIP